MIAATRMLIELPGDPWMWAAALCVYLAGSGARTLVSVWAWWQDRRKAEA